MMEKKKRPDWDSYFLEIASLVATRSTCRRRRVGAVLVGDKRILTTGYNGAPCNLKHCLDSGCLREKMKIPSGERQELCRGLHAEQNAVIQAALYGVPIAGSTMYVTCQPCITCVKMLINCKIARIVTHHEYPDEFARKMLAESGIRYERK
ncbi:MAG: cytidine/deoxycytidylate deaminase family protein [Candidatus Omnitrophota bacterium]